MPGGLQQGMPSRAPPAEPPPLPTCSHASAPGTRHTTAWPRRPKMCGRRYRNVVRMSVRSGPSWGGMRTARHSSGSATAPPRSRTTRAQSRSRHHTAREQHNRGFAASRHVRCSPPSPAQKARQRAAHEVPDKELQRFAFCGRAACLGPKTATCRFQAQRSGCGCGGWARPRPTCPCSSSCCGWHGAPWHAGRGYPRAAGPQKGHGGGGCCCAQATQASGCGCGSWPVSAHGRGSSGCLQGWGCGCGCPQQAQRLQAAQQGALRHAHAAAWG